VKQKASSACRHRYSAVSPANAAAFQQSQGSQLVLILAAIVVIYGSARASLYESYVHPLTILSGLPSAAIGALGALQLFGLELTVVASIGVLLLIGIVKKNAIMMIDFALEAQRQGTADGNRDTSGLPAALPSDHDDHAVRIDGRAAAGPSALATEGELRQPLGIAVSGGLIFSQLIHALYHHRFLFIYMEHLRALVARNGGFLSRLFEDGFEDGFVGRKSVAPFRPF